MTEQAVQYRAQGVTAQLVGVAPLVCSCCREVVGVENHEAGEIRCRDGEHYFCSACMELPPAVVEERLAVNSCGDVLTQAIGVCWAYDEESGAICGQPAATLDVERGFTVCAQHQKGGRR